jgi:hypothetical protein
MTRRSSESAPKTWSWPRIQLAAVVVLVMIAAVQTAGARARLEKRRGPDITDCKTYDCSGRYCGEYPYVTGTCIDGPNQLAITIDCCCCTGAHGSNRYFIGG